MTEQEKLNPWELIVWIPSLIQPALVERIMLWGCPAPCFINTQSIVSVTDAFHAEKGLLISLSIHLVK